LEVVEIKLYRQMTIAADVTAIDVLREMVFNWFFMARFNHRNGLGWGFISGVFTLF
jgi:hypothetical protein